MRKFSAWQFVMLMFTISQPVFADGKLAIIIDDIGYNQALSERAARLPGAFTLSILPFTPYSFSSSQIAQHFGKELMLHVPMSNMKNMPLGQGGLYSGMGKDLLVATLRRDLNNVPFIKGVNNHMGSRLTQDAEAMSWVMQEVSARGLYFVDSRTSVQTKAFDMAQAHSIPSLKRDVFLDDVDEPAAIKIQLLKAIRLASQRGTAVAIGHPYANTLSVLERIEPLLNQHHITLVLASALLISPSLPPKNFLRNMAVTNTRLTSCPSPPIYLQMRQIVDKSVIQLSSMTLADIWLLVE